jgi:hypothetical protein
MKRASVVLVLACATLSVVSSTSGAISLKAAGRQYLKDVAPANAALESFKAEISAWTNATPNALGERQAAAVLSALDTLQKNLLSQRWPHSIEGGVQFIVREDIASLEEDMNSVTANSSLGNGALQSTFRADTQTIDSDAFYVRRDLGLPSSGAL